MKIFSYLGSGLVRSLKAWKGILAIWFLNLILVSLIAIPFRAGLKSVLHNSMITELLGEGINIDVFADFGSNLKVIASSVFSGFFLVILLGFIMNVFLAGGLFTITAVMKDFPEHTHFIPDFLMDWHSFKQMIYGVNLGELYENRNWAGVYTYARIEEGADIIMVKPALPYLDIIHRIREEIDLPVAAYSVSGEFAMIKAAEKMGWLDGQKAMLEALTAIKRAGADMILTYFAIEVAESLQA